MNPNNPKHIFKKHIKGALTFKKRWLTAFSLAVVQSEVPFLAYSTW